LGRALKCAYSRYTICIFCANSRYTICKIITSFLGNYFTIIFLKNIVLLVSKVIILPYICFPNIMLLITKVIILLSTKRRMNGYKEVEQKEIGPRCEMFKFFLLIIKYNVKNKQKDAC
jgi:hypothetical protein